MRKKLLLVDAMSLLHRAFHAYPVGLSSPDGRPTNAVYGFVSILLSVYGRIEPTHTVIAWDMHAPTFRHQEFVDYKGSREKPDDLLIEQIAITKEVIETMGIPQFGVGGFEADDVIGTVALRANDETDVQVVILTGDRDALQLVREERVVVYMPAPPGKYADRGPAVYDREAVIRKYELSPEQLIDLKALMGDKSDDVPGVKGIGEKTAIKIIKEYKDLDKLYSTIEQDRPEVESKLSPRVVKMLVEDRQMAYLSKKLVTIVTEVPLEFDWSKAAIKNYDKVVAEEKFAELGFKSLIARLPADSWDSQVEEVFA